MEDEKEQGVETPAQELVGSKIIIPFQNENLCAHMELDDGSRVVKPLLLCCKILTDTASSNCPGLDRGS